MDALAKNMYLLAGKAGTDLNDSIEEYSTSCQPGGQIWQGRRFKHFITLISSKPTILGFLFQKQGC
jgi:hypothetical protein